MRSPVRNLIGLGGFFLIWEAAARLDLVSAKTIPPASTVLTRLYELKWAARSPGNRIVNFTRNGEKQFAALFGVGTE